MRKILLTLPVLLLASCGPIGGPPAPNPGPAPLPAPVPPVTNPDPGPQPQPQPTAPFIPAAGAAVGTGDGTRLGTVYVSPNAQEVEFMTLLNEVRTKGTVNGVDVRAGTCLAGVQPGTLKPLTYNGVMAYASRKHSTYMGTWGFEGHEELNSAHPNFYGYDLADRIYRAYAELGLGTPGMVSGGENVTARGNQASQAIDAFLHSPPHCTSISQNDIASVGVGYVNAPYESGTPTKPTVYDNNWTVNFGR